MAWLTVDHLRVGHRLRDLSLTLEAGEVLGIIGPNGSGKSTLLSSLAGLLPYEGRIELLGRCTRQMPARERARRVGFLPQKNDSAWSLRVRDVVRLGRLPWGDDNEAAVERAMAQADVQAFGDLPVDALSGGEQARVWLARVLAGEPTLLLADEPIASLDLRYQKSILQTLRQFATSGRSVVVALHDLSLAARYCDRLCLLHQGQLVAHGPTREVLDAERLSQVFGVEVHVDLAADPPIVSAR